MPTLISERPRAAEGSEAKRFVVRDALAAGFDTVAVADPQAFGTLPGARLREAIAEGRHGEMEWLERTEDRRRHPQALWSDVRSVVMVGLNYGPDHDPMDDLAHDDRGVISVYARGKDYHDVMKGRLKTLAQRLHARFGGDVKVFVDTAPVMEKPLAALAGIGWQGKHTNLVSRQFGSWLFLGSLFTTLKLPADTPHGDRCGGCTRCLTLCPTSAFPEPYKLDARRCLAYLTIEAPGMIPREFRKAMGNRIFGCDDCLAVCPWNKFATTARDGKVAAPDRQTPDSLQELSQLDDATFRKKYAGTPVKRLGRERFVRNVMVAAGNAAGNGLRSAIVQRLRDDAPQVRAGAVWAARQTLPEGEVAALAATHVHREHCAHVRSEWGRFAP